MVLGVSIMYRVMFINGGISAEYESIDIVLHAFHVGATLIAVRLNDVPRRPPLVTNQPNPIRCVPWRGTLYSSRWGCGSRNIPIILLPAFLFICGGVCAIVIFTTGFLVADNRQYATINTLGFYVFLGLAIVNTVYVTTLVAGRLWWVGRKADLAASPEQVRNNRYQSAITALVQSGAMYTISNVLSVISGGTKN
ncbi:hypothetical protein FRB96_008145, partial [Tulasnella sp. 330]